MKHLYQSRFSALAALAVVLAGACSSGMDLNDPHTQLNFGVRAAEMDLWREARFRFERAVQLNPNDPAALNNLAVAYEGSGDFDRARLTYLQALRVDQGNQYIQKNYSRFMEFYNRNRKREQSDPLKTGEAAAPATGSAPAAAPSPVPAIPPSNPPGGEPLVQPGPGGQQPASIPAPPDTTPVVAPTPPPNGATR